MRLEGETWTNYFRDFKRSAWRLETHAIYTMPQEQGTYQRFLSREKPTGEHATDWAARVAQMVSSGRTIGRVHVLTRPLSDYLRYEFEWWYQFNVQAGEDIRILDLTDQANPGLPDEDYWLFDDSTVVRMLYRSDGTQIGRELVETPDIDKYLRYQRIALAGAVPFGEYWQG